MFPLTNKEPYIKSSGERTTLGDMFAQTGGDISELEREIQALTNQLEDEAETRSALGAKNLLNITATTITDHDVTFTVNANGTITANGTATGGNAVIVINETQKFKAGNYIYTCTPKGINDSDTICSTRTTRGFDVNDKTDYGDGVALSLANDGTNAIYTSIVVYQNKTVNNAIFKPMIRLATDSDTTYQPYAMTNRELTVDKVDKSDLASISITGTTNNTGSTIVAGTYFYLNGALVKAKTSISNGATLTSGTNYESVSAGGLNAIPKIKSVEVSVDSVTIAAGDMADIKVDDSALITDTTLGVPAYSIEAVIFTWSTGHICVPSQCYVSGNKNGIYLSLRNPSASSVTVKSVQLSIFYV